MNITISPAPKTETEDEQTPRSLLYILGDPGGASPGDAIGPRKYRRPDYAVAPTSCPWVSEDEKKEIL